MSILNKILENRFVNLYEAVKQALDEISYDIVEDYRVDVVNDALDEAARFSVVNRVRGGKVQRRHKVSNMPGYRFQDGRLVRMSSREKLHRKLAQRKGAIKRRAKVSTALRKRKISIRKRGAL